MDVEIAGSGAEVYASCGHYAGEGQGEGHEQAVLAHRDGCTTRLHHHV
jgi:hypothetical protein